MKKEAWALSLNYENMCEDEIFKKLWVRGG